MVIITIDQAKQQLTYWITQALNGEEILIAKNQDQLVKLTSYDKKPTSRKGGQLKGILIIEDNFDDPLPEKLTSCFLQPLDECGP